MDLSAITTHQTLDKISKHCPRAITTYLTIIGEVDENNQAFFSRRQVVFDMNESWTIFKNNVRALASENLLEWHEIDDGISITLYPDE